MTREQVPAFAESPVPEPGGGCDEYDEHDEAAQLARLKAQAAALGVTEADKVEAVARIIDRDKVRGVRVPARGRRDVPSVGRWGISCRPRGRVLHGVRVRGARGSALMTCSKRHRGKN